ncbi:pyridoxamine 5'-phosphate oxidase family protein [Mucilaginibacter sp. 44-25]|uniref:pyridoxamine 5'-phosphate oxidase family protein n=1 Tax=Mucilaginibacter sp. 44-25 TaxID=1895794 RepID=UPI000959A8FA|nr:pyridoxamine 5'-phosphate oxidase family protein [Mucilaginibacter sp. 44-25]OJW16817.1 MAG: pyridoxamine 5'-phosphate oxidase [Mucilaginibacter sp. 44-25]PMP65288.1 MAG: pyridoxamine 5'-phosphate oxidase [Mucilaginibacter sp.]HEK19610.1 pyridoxamine 5'-phosphate oxidase family protein [Bacteroidota bacterium]
MLGELNDTQIDALLKAELTGRIGCQAAGVVYIVPVNYVYDGTNIYGHSAKGMKIDVMRENPEVCFEVDKIKDITTWQSVIAWGKFEEITEMDEQQKVLQKLTDRISPFIMDDSVTREHGFVDEESDIGTIKELIMYKIVLHKKTGRFEDR